MSGVLSKLAHPGLVRLAGIAIGVIFVFAGLSKIGDMSAFALQVHNYRMAPVAVENLIAMLLPWVEVVAGAALIFNLRSRAASWICLLLMLLFTVGVAQAWARGLNFECGCFGKADSSKIGFQKLAENVGMTLMAWVATLRRVD